MTLDNAIVTEHAGGLQVPDPSIPHNSPILFSHRVQEHDVWCDLVNLAQGLYRFSCTSHGLDPMLWDMLTADEQRPFLYAALAATGTVDDVRKDVARHAGIRACTQFLADRHGLPVTALQAADIILARYMANDAMDARTLALEGTTSNQPLVRALVHRVQTLHSARQIEATVEPGGAMRMVAAEVR